MAPTVQDGQKSRDQERRWALISLALQSSCRKSVSTIGSIHAAVELVNLTAETYHLSWYNMALHKFCELSVKLWISWRIWSEKWLSTQPFNFFPSKQRTSFKIIMCIKNFTSVILVPNFMPKGNWRLIGWNFVSFPDLIHVFSNKMRENLYTKFTFHELRRGGTIWSWHYEFIPAWISVSIWCFIYVCFSMKPVGSSCWKVSLPTLTPAGWKLRSHAGSGLRANFSRLIEKYELLPSCLTQFPKIC